MKVNNKIISLIIVVLFSLLLVSCKNNVTRSNYDKIYLNMEKKEVIKLLGEPNEKIMNIHNDEYYWFSDGRDMEEAYELAKKGKDVKYIIVVFSVELTNKTQIVLNKKYGNVVDIIGEGK